MMLEIPAQFKLRHASLAHCSAPAHHSRGADVCRAACHNAAVLPLRTIRVTRYVTPLREGGSLPAIVEADDDGLYALKFRGGGRGPRRLMAEPARGQTAR